MVWKKLAFDDDPPAAHESTHVSGGSDEINSALAIAAMANLANGKIWKGNASNRPTEIDVPSGATIVTGSYTGDNADNRQITIGFKPTLIFLYRPAATKSWWFIFTSMQTIKHSLAVDGYVVWSTMNDLVIHASDGFVVDKNWANNIGVTYYYWAISA
ncbi:hypothetical protein ES703_81241 [subsurface metagenome]